MIFDTHTHVFIDNFSDQEQVLLNAKKKNITSIIVGFNNATNFEAIQVSSKYSLPLSLGIHPCDIEDFDLLTFEDLIVNNKVCAIGECGLDYHWFPNNKEQQKEVFERQIELSIKYDLPIIVHVRDAIADAYQVLKRYEGQIKGVMHSFSGSLEMAYEFIKIGMHIGIGGPVTFTNAVEPKKIAKNIPIENLLIETDCPYLTPHPFRGKRNEPSNVLLVLDRIADIRGLPKEELERRLEENTRTLFKI